MTASIPRPSYCLWFPSLKTEVRHLYGATPHPCDSFTRCVRRSFLIHYTNLEFGYLRHRRTRLTPTPSLRATLSHQERENKKWGCGSDRRFMARRYHCVMKRLLVSPQVRALISPSPLGRGWSAIRRTGR